MNWKLFADLAEAVGEKEVPVDADPGDTVRDALDALLADHPALAERVLTEEGELEEHINLLRNGRNVHTAESGLETELEDDDELALSPPVSGG